MCFLLNITGCQVLQKQGEFGLPNKVTIEREHLKIYSDFRLPRKHRLFEDLERLRDDLNRDLMLPSSDEQVEVYLFADPEDFRKYAARIAPELRDRRAFFIKTDTRLRVYGHWGDHLGEDLRHETCHAYLHAVIDDLPLWLDEGIAEYYELEQYAEGLHRQHVFLLANAFRKGTWTPNLTRLEVLSEPESLTQIDYAEAWLWVHFMMHHQEDSPKILQDALARRRMSGNKHSLSKDLDEKYPDAQLLLVEHLKHLSETL